MFLSPLRSKKKREDYRRRRSTKRRNKIKAKGMESAESRKSSDVLPIPTFLSPLLIPLGQREGRRTHGSMKTPGFEIWNWKWPGLSISTISNIAEGMLEIEIRENSRTQIAPTGPIYIYIYIYIYCIIHMCLDIYIYYQQIPILWSCSPDVSVISCTW